MNTPPESFIHYLWMRKLVPSIGLQTSSGQSIQILKYGELNTIGGPDVFNSKIKIGETIWAGNVEIHIKASEWYSHKHQFDEAYNNVILHVVYENDKPVLINNQEVETLILPKELCSRHFGKYERLIESTDESKIPCASFLEDIPDIIIESWKTRLLAERIELNLRSNSSDLDIYNFVWNKIAAGFGMKYNKNPMKIIAESIDFRELKEKSKTEIDNIFLELSGLNFPIEINENDCFQTKILIEGKPIIKPEWKFGGIRPMNQPIIKLMQFSSFFSLSSDALLDLILEGNFKKIQGILQEVRVHKYWETHSSFYKKCKPRSIKLGSSFQSHLMINAISPLFYHLNKGLNNKDVSEELMQFFESQPKEKNTITKKMKNSGFKNKNAFDSQALIQLNNYYCRDKKCLHCAIGNKILK